MLDFYIASPPQALEHCTSVTCVTCNLSSFHTKFNVDSLL